MIAFNQRRRSSRHAWQKAFVALLPKIRQYVESAFRRLLGEEREEAIEEAIANACVAFARLARQGRSDRAFPTALARFAIRQVRSGRKVGTSLCSRDVMSRQAQQRRQFTVERLHYFDAGDDQWVEGVVPDPRTPVLDQVWFRLDFPEWLAQLSRRDRRVALQLAQGHSTSHVAKRFRLSAGRVSQLRRELHESWQEFHGEMVLSTAVCA